MPRLMNKSIVKHIQTAQKNHKKLLAILLDPDKLAFSDIAERIHRINTSNVDYILVGGSLLFSDILDAFILEVKKHSLIPVILFPGNAVQISNKADAILFLSLLSGRNPEFLIGNHVVAAPILKKSGLEIVSTSYLLIESGRETTASYISNTKPIPRHKPEIAMATALAGEMMGHELVYLDGGSGALKEVPVAMIQKVYKNLSIPIIVGGGIRTKKQLQNAYKAGATMVVVGTAFEKYADLLDGFL